MMFVIMQIRRAASWSRAAWSMAAIRFSKRESIAVF
jgi:hypothetical protein